MTYQQMAYIYDQFMTDAPYDDWITFTEKTFKKLDFKGSKIADLGCGTGEITTRLAGRGYDLTGVDSSSDMLAVAEQKASEKQLSVRWLRQDLQSLQGLYEYDGVVSFCDVMNYMISRQEIKQVFQNIVTILREGGLFLFDVHALHHVEKSMVNQTFADITDESAYIWFCEEGDEPGEMYHDLTFFIKNGDKYDKFSEFHHQKTLSIKEYIQCLKEVGFQIKGVYKDFLTENNKRDREAERIFFVAEKRSGEK